MLLCCDSIHTFPLIWRSYSWNLCRACVCVCVVQVQQRFMFIAGKMTLNQWEIHLKQYTPTLVLQHCPDDISFVRIPTPCSRRNTKPWFHSYWILKSMWGNKMQVCNWWIQSVIIISRSTRVRTGNQCTTTTSLSHSCCDWEYLRVTTLHNTMSFCPHGVETTLTCILHKQTSLCWYYSALK